MLRKIVIGALILLLPSTAFAQAISVEASAGAQTGQSEPAGTEVSAPQIKKTGQTYHGRLAAGHQLYQKGDYSSALSEYEAAKQMSPGDPIAYYFIGCTQARLARYDDAIVTLKTTSTLAGDKNPSLHAKALFFSAVVEEMRWRLDEAEAAWNAYRGFAQTHDSAKTFPNTPEARLAAIEKMRKLDKEYSAVRERLESSK
jgi:tetratricopeptide (TPR) repeat protein